MRFNSSEECMKSELDIFTVPPTQSSIENGIWVNKEAENGFASDSGTVTFNIDALSDAYIDLSETYLSLKVSIRKNFFLFFKVRLYGQKSDAGVTFSMTIFCKILNLIQE